MKEEFVNVLRLRFAEKDRRMIERFTAEKQQLNARGPLNSSETVKAMHKVLETELKESSLTVATTAVDIISRRNLPLAENELQDCCSEAFAKRRDEIEALYLSDVRHIEDGLQNKAMLQPYMSLAADFYQLQREEMLINLSSAYEKYKRDRGGNLASEINNRFLNRPMVAWAVIVIKVILVIAAFAGAIVGLRSLYG